MINPAYFFFFLLQSVPYRRQGWNTSKRPNRGDTAEERHREACAQRQQIINLNRRIVELLEEARATRREDGGKNRTRGREEKEESREQRKGSRERASEKESEQPPNKRERRGEQIETPAVALANTSDIPALARGLPTIFVGEPSEPPYSFANLQAWMSRKDAIRRAKLMDRGEKPPYSLSQLQEWHADQERREKAIIEKTAKQREAETKKTEDEEKAERSKNAEKEKEQRKTEAERTRKDLEKTRLENEKAMKEQEEAERVEREILETRRREKSKERMNEDTVVIPDSPPQNEEKAVDDEIDKLAAQIRLLRKGKKQRSALKSKASRQ